jgi:hypothetical protein
LFGRSTWPSDQGTVAAARIDGRLVFGASSNTPVYENADRAVASEWRDILIEKYPDVMRSDNAGYKPNDALYHAEATVLLKAIREHGSLQGRTVEIHADRLLCGSCDKVLPYLALELGNPTVIFVEPTGATKMLEDGVWRR